MNKPTRLDRDGMRIDRDEDLGRYNDMPPNAKEISREEFERKLYHGSYSPDRIKFKQVYESKSFGAPCMNMRLFIYHDGTGVAVGSKYLGGDKYEARFFKFAKCEHEMGEISAAEARAAGIYHGGRCYHVLKCTKCGYVSAYDSSD